MKEIKQALDTITQGMQSQVPVETMNAFGNSIMDLQTKSFGTTSEVGMMFPSVEVVTESNQQTPIVDLFKGKKTLVSFVRGNWCPFCNIEIAHLMSYYPTLQDKGVEVIVVSPMSIELLKDWKSEVKMSFPIVQDKNLVLGNALDIKFELQDFVQPHYEMLGIDLKHLNQTEKTELNIPAVYLIDDEGRISFRYMDVNYGNRLDLSEIVNSL
ncbi:peroxiredoxin-like family protein [Myroides odoratimimus]|uniref:peroxiredoxin-like family protein n=1 Tax=Myroides odoratimimus TaxID=76832 RepID=UPI003100B82F